MHDDLTNDLLNDSPRTDLSQSHANKGLSFVVPDIGTRQCTYYAQLPRDTICLLICTPSI